MTVDYRQIEWDDRTAADCRELVRLAVREDLDRLYDWTTIALVPEGAQGHAAIAARKSGVLAGLPAVLATFAEMEVRVNCTPLVADGTPLAAGQRIALLEGSARSLLTCERIALNFLGRLSGIATLAHRYVEQVAGTGARIYDTRKTTPGWRRLEKYAVRQGGACNHRLGLFDAILIKDNHLAFGSESRSAPFSPAEAVLKARDLARQWTSAGEAEMIVEIEVDSLSQLAEALPARPDIVLLDNMSLDDLRQAAAMRNEGFAGVELEASGGVDLSTVAGIARTGVERISVGALTHSAVSLDVGLDWL